MYKRHSQAAIFVVANQSKLFNLIFSSPYDRVCLFNYIFSKANKGCSKHKFRYKKCLYDLNFSKQSKTFPLPILSSFSVSKKASKLSSWFFFTYDWRKKKKRKDANGILTKLKDYCVEAKQNLRAECVAGLNVADSPPHVNSVSSKMKCSATALLIKRLNSYYGKVKLHDQSVIHTIDSTKLYCTANSVTKKSALSDC